jgi:23S rRNA (uracil1939-C5)-methyltransferase
MSLTIEKMIYGGDGLARNPGGRTVFMPLVLPGEEVDATITEEKPGYARAIAHQLLKTSDRRVEPSCPYFSRCGGCHYQHTDYPNQLEFKKSILRETLLRSAKLDWKPEIVTHSAAPWGYRNRTRFKVRHAPEFAIGFHRMASHDLLPVEKCPISSPAINRVLSYLWELGRAQRIPRDIGEIEIFANHDDSRLMLEVQGAESPEFAAGLRAGLPEISGVAFFTAGNQAGIFGDGSLNYQAGSSSFRVSAGSFFQTNRFLVPELAETVVADVSGSTALDLYAGVGLFALRLAGRYKRVLAVESSPSSAADLKFNAPKNVTAIRTTTEEFLAKSQDLRPDIVVADPPRAGLGDKTVKLLAAMRVPRITYLSCDPTTLARDLNGLIKSRYRVEEVHLFDLFPQTFHIESMVRLAR